MIHFRVCPACLKKIERAPLRHVGRILRACEECRPQAQRVELARAKHKLERGARVATRFAEAVFDDLGERERELLRNMVRGRL